MPNDHKIFVDAFAETKDLLQPITDGYFYNFSEVEPEPGATYVIGRVEVGRNRDKICRESARRDINLVFTSAAEGSETMLGQLLTLDVKESADRGDLKILCGGDMGAGYQHLALEYFLVRTHQYEENHQSARRINEIFEKENKPYKFLFLNGRLRHHRKWMIRRLSLDGLLDQALWTCLMTFNHHSRGLTLIHQGQDLMQTLENIKMLPESYEIDRYKDLTQKNFQDVHWLKPHLFQDEWGDVYIKAEPYIDTYFSLVTETVFDTPCSFRTEKIWKPIMMGHPWICVANQGFYRGIKDLGFRTFGDIIDESFDDIQDGQQRIEKTYQVVKDLCSRDLATFLRDCKEVCIHNQQHAAILAQQQRQNIPDLFQEWIKQYKL